MKSVRWLAIVAVVAGSLVVLSAPAGAASKTNKTKFCNSVATNLTNINSGNPSDKTEAKRIQSALNKAAGYASGSLKTATKNLADFYGKIAKGQNAAAALSAMGTKYITAATTFTSYVGTNCPSAFAGTTTTSTTTSSGSSGSSSAGNTTSTTIVGSQLECSADKTALDALEAGYKALKGKYGTMSDLVSAGLLTTASKYHTVTVSTDGSSYTIQGC